MSITITGEIDEWRMILRPARHGPRPPMVYCDGLFLVLCGDFS